MAPIQNSSYTPPPSAHPTNHTNPAPNRKLHPDPIRHPPPSHHSTHHTKSITGCGPHRSYRHVSHQRGTIGTFHVRLLEGRGLKRRHWSVMSLGPMKNLGLSRAHGEVSSFGVGRLAFWRGEDWREFGGMSGVSGDASGGEVCEKIVRGSSSLESLEVDDRKPAAKPCRSGSGDSSESSHGKQHQSNGYQPSKQQMEQPTNSFLPSMPPMPQKQGSNGTASFDAGKSPLTPLFDQGCIRSFSPARSPFYPAYASQQQQQKSQDNHLSQNQNGVGPTSASTAFSSSKSRSTSQVSTPRTPLPSESPAPTKSQPRLPSSNPVPFSQPLGPPPPHHYAREEFRSSTVHNDSNPIWGDAQTFLSSSHHNDNNNHSNQNRSTFHIPLQKDDLYPTLHSDGGRISLELRLEEPMAAAESLLVGGALSGAVSAATAATSVVTGKGVGRKAQEGAEVGMEMLGLGKDRLIGRGWVDLMPLLLGFWDEDWEKDGNGSELLDNNGDLKESEDADLDEFGRIHRMARRMRQRVERMGMLDVWVPLYHPSAPNDPNTGRKETSGKVHLLISYEPNGMTPKPNDVVALESFARHPNNDASFSLNAGPILTPIIPSLSPLLVIDTRNSYLLLEYLTSRTITSVDRTGNVKSSRWERTHRVRIHRHAAFVIERRTLMDTAGDIARMPGDIVLSTPLGREVAEVSAPLVAATMELMGPALLWGKLMVAAGGTGVKAGLAGAQAATEAVVRASQEKALQGRECGYLEEGESGVYRYGG